jgi:chaperonin GroEL
MGVPIDPPYTAGGTQLFLSDIAVMTGAQVYNGINFSPEMLGQAKEVLVNGYSTTVLSGKGDKVEIRKRIKSLKDQLKTETHPNSIQFIKERLGRLSGKMAIIRVGGAIEFERDEKMLRVQDAVCAVQSALKDGIAPGGGVTLARIQGTEFDDAFKQPFRQLVINAGLNPDALLAKVEGSGTWKGFNLKKITPAPLDLLSSGIVDPSLVLKEVVTNAISVVSGLITASAAIAWNTEDKQS